MRQGQGRIEEAAWHQLLAAWINDSYPNPVSWEPVTRLEQDLPPLMRVAEAPERLQPGNPCRLVRGMLEVYGRTIPEFETAAVKLFQQRYPGCFAHVTGGAAKAD